jgi:hypothetical protein
MSGFDRLLRLSGSYRNLEHRVAELTAELDAMRHHFVEASADFEKAAAWGRALEAERDELAGHALRLEDQWSHARLRADTLEKERDELLGHLVRINAEVEDVTRALEARRVQLWAEPGHFYSPIVGATPRIVERLEHLGTTRFQEPPVLPGGDERQMLDLLASIAPAAAAIPLPDEPSEEFTYFAGNPQFTYVDAAVYAGMLCHFRPARVVEVGSGHSTCLLLDVDRLCLGSATSITAIEPYPDRLLSLVPPALQERIRLLRSPLQEVSDDVFSELQPGDFLFLDSSHVAKTGSDVLDYLFRVFPLLAPGVIVHIHDIFYPFEYALDWVVTENRSWNETYFVRAFLEGNPRWRMLLFTDYLFNRYPDVTAGLLPRSEGATGGSLWLRVESRP